MDPALHDKILALLDEHRILSLATLRPDGWPQATTVGYVNDGMEIYFMCAKDSQKAHNLARDNRVALTIDHDTPNPMAIHGLSMAARAVPVTDKATLMKVLLEFLPKKYPEYGPMMSQADMSQMVAFRLVPKVISVLDYSKGFGHSDLVQVAPENEPA
jgi:nitroimidazol reductase NimA-like FMN-containing flavoprotein (pyridoxamine 5'-phosphate oxidase superfamily)